MPIETNATYRDGALYPDQPLNLPENTPVLVRVLTATDRDLTPEEILALRPKAPRLTVEQFDEIMRKNTFRAPSLSPDFSREDIYSDHD